VSYTLVVVLDILNQILLIYEEVFGLSIQVIENKKL